MFCLWLDCSQLYCECISVALKHNHYLFALIKIIIIITYPASASIHADPAGWPCGWSVRLTVTHVDEVVVGVHGPVPVFHHVLAGDGAIGQGPRGRLASLRLDGHTRDWPWVCQFWQALFSQIVLAFQPYITLVCILLYFMYFQDLFWTLQKLVLLLFLWGSASETPGLVLLEFLTGFFSFLLHSL